MALDDIVDYVGEPVRLEMSRGNIGTISDINVQAQIEIEIPAQSGVATNSDYVYIS